MPWSSTDCDLVQGTFQELAFLGHACAASNSAIQLAKALVATVFSEAAYSTIRPPIARLRLTETAAQDIKRGFIQ